MLLVAKLLCPMIKLSHLTDSLGDAARQLPDHRLEVAILRSGSMSLSL